MSDLELVVERDHLDRLARASPTTAISELIWNALDAEASRVRIQIVPSTLANDAAIGAVVVEDNGHGMTRSEAEESFGHLGGSWKARSERSRNGLVPLHGQEGQGRFRALALGGAVEWESVAESGDQLERTTVTILRASSKRCTIEVSDCDAEETGTRVTISDPTPASQSLVHHDRLVRSLTSKFALRLRAQRELEIAVNEEALDPTSIQSFVADYKVDFENPHGPIELTVIEWTIDVPRDLHLCDRNGSSLHTTKAGIQAPTFNFTAYVSWQGFREHEAVLGLEEMSTDIGPVLDAVRSKLRDHFRLRADQVNSAVISTWKAEGSYPYGDDEPDNAAEAVERQVFDLFALTVNAANPGFRRSDPDNKKMTLRLLQEAVERSPESLHQILHEVAQLESGRLDELATLLETTDLAKVISATRQVTDRLDFLHALELLVFDNKGEVKETRHLHRILERELWVFGDHFDSAISERGLTNALREHIRVLGRTDPVQEPVRNPDGSLSRLDLMLSAQVAGRGRLSTEHLVVELKSPDIQLGMTEFSQIQNYATTILSDARFDSAQTHWEFFLIGNDFDPALSRLVEDKPDRPPGLADHGDNYKIWVLRWNRLIADHRRRLLFMRDALEHSADDDASLGYLRRTHASYLPDSMNDEESA